MLQLLIKKLRNLSYVEGLDVVKNVSSNKVPNVLPIQ